MTFRQSLFWDTDPTRIDSKKHATYIIERIMELGNDDDVRWMWKTYPKNLLAQVAATSKTLHKSSKNLWTKLII